MNVESKRRQRPSISSILLILLITGLTGFAVKTWWEFEGRPKDKPMILNDVFIGGPIADLPDPRQIKKIRIWDIATPPGELPLPKELVITDRFDNFLSPLMPYYPDPRPADWETLCSLEFHMQDGSIKNINIWATGKAEGAFSMDGKPYRGGSDFGIYQALRELARVHQAKMPEK